MSVSIPYRREMSFEYGKLERLSPMIRRIIAHNPSAFTFHGTGTYVLGEGSVAVIDPGPDDPRHDLTGPDRMSTPDWVQQPCDMERQGLSTPLWLAPPGME